MKVGSGTMLSDTQIISLLTSDEVAFANDLATKYQPMYSLNGWVWGGHGAPDSIPSREQIAHVLMVGMGEIKLRGRGVVYSSRGRLLIKPVWGPEPERSPRGWAVTVEAGIERYYCRHELFNSEEGDDPADIVPARWTCSMTKEHSVGGHVDSPLPGPPTTSPCSLESGQLEITE